MTRRANSMIQVTELGYMGVGVKNLEEWKNFATSIVGMELVDDGESDRCYLRMDYQHHRIVLHADGSDDLSYLGFRVAGAEEFSAMQTQLSEAGIKFRVFASEEAEERRNLDDVGMTYDLVRRNKIPVTIQPGKHSNDHMYSFYFRNPSGWMFEYGWGARAATYQSEYFVEDVYGHQPENGGFDISPNKTENR